MEHEDTRNARSGFRKPSQGGRAGIPLRQFVTGARLRKSWLLAGTRNQAVDEILWSAAPLARRERAIQKSLTTEFEKIDPEDWD